MPSQLTQTRRAVYRQRCLAAAQRERLQHPRQPEDVVGVEVREEDRVELGQPDLGAQQLALRSFGAVEQQALAAATDEQRSGSTLRRGQRGRGAEQDEIEIHGCR